MINRRQVIASSLVMATGIKTVRAQVVQLELKVELSTDRDQIGKVWLRKHGLIVAGPFQAFGRSDNTRAAAHQNTMRDPTKPYGDTPTGTYEIPRAIKTGDGTRYNNRSYGPNGALVLKPAGGQAATAAANGRVGLLVHGGDLSSSRKLRATHGCLRLSNADMASLMASIVAAGENATFNRCELTRINATVGERGDTDAGEDAGDPPPGIEALLGIGPIRLP